MKKHRLYVDVHVLQTVPPSCINRDDTNSPKTAVYGGVRRARVSSQAWKRAARSMFLEKGVRTLRVFDVIVDKIMELDPHMEREEAEKVAEKTLTSAGVKLDKKKEYKTGALFFISPRQIEDLASCAIQGVTDKKELQAVLNANPTIDVALFGRMVADDPLLNTDASCQVAHAISTHRTETEFDFFTAIDDRSPEDNAGAAMMGTVEYNSCTLYRYATVAAHDLKEQLGSDHAAAEAVVEFAGAFITAMPTGKQNTFANRTLPDHVLITVRNDQPVNLVGAFEKPVRGKEGYVEESVERLEAYAQDVYAKFSGIPHRSYVVSRELNLQALLARLKEEVRYDLAY